MGFFDKLKSGLAKTKNAVFSQVDSILKSFVKVDEDLLEELEEALICSDMGMECAEKVIDELRDAVREGRLKEPEEVKAALKYILRGMIGEGELIVNSSRGGGSKDTWVLAGSSAMVRTGRPDACWKRMTPMGGRSSRWMTPRQGS